MSSQECSYLPKKAVANKPVPGGKKFLEQINVAPQIKSYGANAYDWLHANVVPVILVAIALYLIHYYGRKMIKKMVEFLVTEKNYGSPRAEKNREETVIRTMNWIMDIFLFFVLILFLLSRFGLDAKTLAAVTGALVVGIGFASRSVLEDIFTGFFIVTGKQYQVGDIVSFDDMMGKVIDVNLRMTTIRSWSGGACYIRHGAAKQIINHTREMSGFEFDIAIPVTVGARRVICIVNREGELLAKDSRWTKIIIKPPKVVRFVKFGDNNLSVVYKVVGQTSPGEHNDVAVEFTLRLMEVFREKKIDMIVRPQNIGCILSDDEKK